MSVACRGDPWWGEPDLISVAKQSRLIPFVIKLALALAQITNKDDMQSLSTLPSAGWLARWPSMAAKTHGGGVVRWLLCVIRLGGAGTT